MSYSNLNTPKKGHIPIRLQKSKRFTRKPAQKSQRSLSRKSSDHSHLKQMYIRTPGSIKKQQAGGPDPDFFQALAGSLLPTAKKQPTYKPKDPYSNLSTSRCAHSQNISDDEANKKISSLKTELQMKSHELSVLTGECQRMKIKLNQQTERRKKYDKQRQSLKGQLKDNQNISESKIRKLQIQKQQLLKHLKAVEAIAYTKQERNLQSYREKYLQEEINRLREQIKKSKGEKQNQLENRLKEVQEDKYCLQSDMKVLILENQSLNRQLNQFDGEGFIINSDIYQKVHNKYKKLMEEFVKVRNENDRLVQQIRNNGNSSNSSQMFSITASEVEKDLSMNRQPSNGHNESNSSFSINIELNRGKSGF